MSEHSSTSPSQFFEPVISSPISPSAAAKSSPSSPTMQPSKSSHDETTSPQLSWDALFKSGDTLDTSASFDKLQDLDSNSFDALMYEALHDKALHDEVSQNERSSTHKSNDEESEPTMKNSPNNKRAHEDDGPETKVVKRKTEVGAVDIRTQETRVDPSARKRPVCATKRKQPQESSATPPRTPASTTSKVEPPAGAITKAATVSISTTESPPALAGVATQAAPSAFQKLLADITPELTVPPKLTAAPRPSTTHSGRTTKPLPPKEAASPLSKASGPVAKHSSVVQYVGRYALASGHQKSEAVKDEKKAGVTNEEKAKIADDQKSEAVTDVQETEAAKDDIPTKAKAKPKINRKLAKSVGMRVCKKNADASDDPVPLSSIAKRLTRSKIAAKKAAVEKKKWV